MLTPTVLPTHLAGTKPGPGELQVGCPPTTHRKQVCFRLFLFLILSIVSVAQADPPANPKYRLVLQAPPALAVDSVAVSPDGSLVATASEGGVRLYDAKSGAFLRAMGGVGD